ncbi:MAG: 30S ribosome-binding factor RbfA [Eggerthellales bacterium]|nr:30S ribosome-binding factor RbfA [Eggerthellales bacterium]
MKQSNANRKVNEQAREVLATILLFEVSDPRLSLVTLTGCEVSYDRSYCNVYYTASPDSYQEVEEGFKAAAGRIRSLMGRRLSWRVTPELRFILDPSVDVAQQISEALANDAARNRESARLRAEQEILEAAELAQQEALEAEDSEE